MSQIRFQCHNLYKKKILLILQNSTKAQKPLGSHISTLLSILTPMHTHKHTSRPPAILTQMIQRAEMVGKFSLALLCGCLKTCLKVGGSLDNRSPSFPSGPVSSLVSYLSLWFLSWHPSGKGKKKKNDCLSLFVSSLTYFQTRPLFTHQDTQTVLINSQQELLIHH